MSTHTETSTHTTRRDNGYIPRTDMKSFLTNTNSESDDYKSFTFLASAPSAPPVFYRSYSHKIPVDSKKGEPSHHQWRRESLPESLYRAIHDIASIGSLTSSEWSLLSHHTANLTCFPSGRSLWVSGRSWSSRPENTSGYYNCVSINMNELRCFGMLMNLSMMGCGAGAVLEKEMVKKLPKVQRTVSVVALTNVGKIGGKETTTLIWKMNKESSNNELWLTVGDSRNGWVNAYQTVIDLASGRCTDLTSEILNTIGEDSDDIKLHVDLSQIRPPGSPLHEFGGIANPIGLPRMFYRVAHILSNSIKRKLTPVEVCLIIDEASSAVIAGNIRRSAGMRQFSFEDNQAAGAKNNLYVQDKEGNWSVDPEREALRLANHTQICHSRPTLKQVRESVLNQYYSGEGALQYAPEAVARANADLFSTRLNSSCSKEAFLSTYENGGQLSANNWLRDVAGISNATERLHRLKRYGLNPCGEIIGCDFHCNLSEVHLNRLNPSNFTAQEGAFRAAGIQVAALLNQCFIDTRHATSRNLDPIVGVSFTGLFDFFVHSLGKGWLEWMLHGRLLEHPHAEKYISEEMTYLCRWRSAAWRGVREYCSSRNMRIPNRITTVQPAGTKSLLTGASPGWHPPKATRFIRRITFQAYDPIALACMDFGYNVIPNTNARDNNGRLLDNIHDPRSTEWLVEIPTEVSWAHLLGKDEVDLSQLNVNAQWGLYMAVQNYYTDHNTSATIEFREDEIDELSSLIHNSMGHGYISVALLGKFESQKVFPRMPYEPIGAEKYKKVMKMVQSRRKSENFVALLEKRDLNTLKENDTCHFDNTWDSTCGSAACIAKIEQMEQKGLSAKMQLY